jgi:hypothetical protein
MDACILCGIAFTAPVCMMECCHFYCIDCYDISVVHGGSICQICDKPNGAVSEIHLDSMDEDTSLPPIKRARTLEATISTLQFIANGTDEDSITCANVIAEHEEAVQDACDDFELEVEASIEHIRKCKRDMISRVKGHAASDRAYMIERVRGFDLSRHQIKSVIHAGKAALKLNTVGAIDRVLSLTTRMSRVGGSHVLKLPKIPRLKHSVTSSFDVELSIPKVPIISYGNGKWVYTRTRVMDNRLVLECDNDNLLKLQVDMESNDGGEMLEWRVDDRSHKHITILYSAPPDCTALQIHVKIDGVIQDTYTPMPLCRGSINYIDTRTVNGIPDFMQSILVTMDGSMIVLKAASFLFIYNSTTHALLRTIPLGFDPGMDMCLTSRNSVYAMNSDVHTVMEVSLVDGTVLRTVMDQYAGPIATNGQYIATCNTLAPLNGDDVTLIDDDDLYTFKQFRIADMQTCEPYNSGDRTGYDNGFRAITFSSDGKHVITAISLTWVKIFALDGVCIHQFPMQSYSTVQGRLLAMPDSIVFGHEMRSIDAKHLLSGELEPVVDDVDLPLDYTGRSVLQYAKSICIGGGNVYALLNQYLCVYPMHT